VLRESRPEEAENETGQSDLWREPPGMLGVYVRRVKKQAKAQAVIAAD
jgi:hypothetical protein